MNTRAKVFLLPPVASDEIGVNESTIPRLPAYPAGPTTWWCDWCERWHHLTPTGIVPCPDWVP